MYRIVVSNEKGGVAKTTTVISLGAALAGMGKRVLLMDLDPLANLTVSMGVEPTRSMPCMYEVLQDNLPIKRAIIPDVCLPGLDLVPSKKELTLVEQSLPRRHGYPFVLRDGLGDPALNYDYVLQDCAPFLGVVTLNAMCAAELLLIPTQAEYFSIYALRNMMDMVSQLRTRGNPRLKYRFLLVMVSLRNRAHRELSERLHEHFSSGVMESVIHTDTRLRESQIAGKPVTVYAPRSRSAQEYRQLAQELVTYFEG